MVYGMKVLGGVLVLGRITAADVAAGHAEPQMNPGIAHLQAFLAAAGVRLHRAHLVHVGAFGHSRPPCPPSRDSGFRTRFSLDVNASINRAGLDRAHEPSRAGSTVLPWPVPRLHRRGDGLTWAMDE